MHERGQQQNLQERYFGFPEGLSFAEYRTLPEDLRRVIIEANPITQTDTYNRTMEHVQGSEGLTPETFTLQLRMAREGYLIVNGVREQIEKVAGMRITQSMLDFAKEAYANGASIPYFNPDKWQEIIDQYDGRLPFDIDAVPDGTAILPGDPVMRVTGPGELVAHFEPYFHRIFYPTRVATIAHEIDEKIGANRFVEVGKRGTPTEEVHLIAASSMYIGGGISLTSNDAAVFCYSELKDLGTIGHRYIQSKETEEEAFRQAIEKLDSVSLLVDLNNTLDGIELAIKMKKEYRESGKKIGIRLDSGDVKEQTLYALRRFQEEGFTDPLQDRIIVEGIEDVNEMAEIDEAVSEAGFDPKSFVMYGAGELLVSKNTGRSFASTGFKLTRHGERDTMKFSDSPGKMSYPGIPTLVDVDGERVIAQIGEYPQGRDLLEPALRGGVVLLKEDISQARETAIRTFDEIRGFVKNGTKSKTSPLTMEAINQCSDLVAAQK